MGQKDSNRSTHLPQVAGNIETVTGSLSVDTGLRNVRSHGANLNEAAAAGKALANAILVRGTNGGTDKLTLQVREDDTTTISSAAASVSWWAFGD